MSNGDIAVLVKGGGQNRPTVFLVETFYIRSASEEGHSERSLGDNHSLSSLSLKKILQNAIENC